MSILLQVFFNKINSFIEKDLLAIAKSLENSSLECLIPKGRGYDVSQLIPRSD